MLLYSKVFLIKTAVALTICFLFRGIASAQSIAEKADTYLKSTLKKKNIFNGTVLIGIKGQVILYRGYGYKNKETGVLNDSATIYQIGSITKTLTSAIILHLYEQKKLRLEEKIINFFPEFPHADKISILHLLTHTSGIRDYLFAKGYDKENFSNPISREKLTAFFAPEKLEFEPGTKFSYSSSGYVLLARIIEQITSNSYEETVRQLIFEPQHMQHSGFDFVGTADTNKAINYKDVRKRHPVSVPVFDSTHAPGSGNMFSTAGDLYKWHQALADKSFLQQQTLQLAYTPIKSKYGLGWFTDTLYDQKNIFHGGGTPGFHANIQRFPDSDVCIVLLSNNEYCDLNEISSRIAAIIFDRAYEENRF